MAGATVRALLARQDKRGSQTLPVLWIAPDPWSDAEVRHESLDAEVKLGLREPRLLVGAGLSIPGEDNSIGRLPRDNHV